jgi:hypothetical protein
MTRNVDGRDKPGHDEAIVSMPGMTGLSKNFRRHSDESRNPARAGRAK